ncbi:MAG TPA: response regulator [Allosphingosinicella sp.]|jgi:PAS domain S-box-containing protein
MAAKPVPNETVRVLHLEDSAIDAELICEMLRAEALDCDIHRVWTREDFENALCHDGFDLILADHQLPTFDGEAALDIARRVAPEIPFIFVSGTLGEDVAVEALKRGATDYVVKQRLDRLAAASRRALAEAAERQERRQAENALRRVEEDFSALVDAMPQLCWMANADGEITWYNRRWHDYTGTTPAEMKGWGWQKVQHPDMLADVVERWSQSLTTGRPFEMVFPLRAADGSFRPFLTRVEPVRGPDGQVTRWFGTNTDVSGQLEAEEKLRSLNDTLEQRVVDAVAERERAYAHLVESQKLETIGQLTGGVAHDFNNLLTPILGNLDMLRRRLDDDARGQRMVGAALQATERARTLVQRLLAFARRQVLETRVVDIGRMLEDTADLIARSLGPRIELVIPPAPDLPHARVDENQLELALLNLAVNARDAMPDGGRLTIEADVQQVGSDHASRLRHGTYVRLAVSDTGGGMDAATLKRAVEPFFSTKGVGKGTGLGLSMVHGLAAQSGGALLLTSAPGEGTRAEIWLPATSDALDAEAIDDSQPAPASKPSLILLVDDEEGARASTAEMLRDLGHEVVEAGSGAAAMQLVRGGLQPALVITDYLMPGMTGTDVAAEVLESGLACPILLITGYAQITGHQAADLPLLTKPFRQAELARRIAPLLKAEAAAGAG